MSFGKAVVVDVVVVAHPSECHFEDSPIQESRLVSYQHRPHLYSVDPNSRICFEESHGYLVLQLIEYHLLHLS